MTDELNQPGKQEKGLEVTPADEAIGDLELSDQDADEVTGGADKVPYITFGLTNATITSGPTSAPPNQT
jgi:hypothetical protein